MTNNLSILVCSYCSRDLDTAQVHQRFEEKQERDFEIIWIMEELSF